MAMKRKFDAASEDAAPNNAKQIKLVPFPEYTPDCDVEMADVQMTDSTDAQMHHIRLPSDASTTSSDSDYESPSYPTFDLYPLPFFNTQGGVNVDSHSYAKVIKARTPSPAPAIGLLQPSTGFTHHGTGCSQIPKLRVASAAGSSGQRTMWSFCEQCGAISMVDSTD